MCVCLSLDCLHCCPPTHPSSHRLFFFFFIIILCLLSCGDDFCKLKHCNCSALICILELRNSALFLAGVVGSSISISISIMLKKVFGKPKSVDTSSTLTTLNQLNEILEMLEKKENLWQKKIAAEVTKAREYSQAKNKKAAIQCLKRKKLYEVQVEQLGNYQLRLHDQMIMLEGANATTETVAALRTGAMAMKALQKTTNIDDVDKTMDDINEQTESFKQIQDALSTPFDMGIDIDEDELEAELEELEELEEEEEVPQLVATPDTKIPTHSPPPTQQVPARSTTQRTKEDDELESLQAEMAI